MKETKTFQNNKSSLIFNERIKSTFFGLQLNEPVNLDQQERA